MDSFCCRSAILEGDFSSKLPNGFVDKGAASLADECEPLIGSSGPRPVGIPETRDWPSVHIVQTPIVAIASKRLQSYSQVCDDQLAELEQKTGRSAGSDRSLLLKIDPLHLHIFR